MKKLYTGNLIIQNPTALFMDSCIILTNFVEIAEKNKNEIFRVRNRCEYVKIMLYFGSLD